MERTDDSIKMVLAFPRKMNQFIKVFASRYLKETSIRPQHLLLIYHIGTSDGISQKELNELVPFDKSYISTMVKDLVEREIVYNDAPGKVHSLHLTNQGRDIFAMSCMMFDLLDRNIFDVLSDEEREQLKVIMGKLDLRLNQLMDKFGEDDC